MIDPANGAIAPRTPPSTRGEPMLLAVLAALCGALGAILHIVVELPASTAALMAAGTLSALAALNAIVQRASAVAKLNGEIANLRSEIARLRGDGANSQQPGPAYPIPTAPFRSRARQAGPMHPGPAPADAGRSPVSEPPRFPAPPGEAAPASGPSTPRSAEPHLPSAPAPAPARATARRAPDWSIRPGTHREPTARIAGAPQANGGPPPLFGPRPAPRAHFAEASAPASEVSPLVGLKLPEPDGAPRAMPRPETGQWPQASPKVPTAQLDLNTMQNLIEQLAGQLHPPLEEAGDAKESGQEDHPHATKEDAPSAGGHAPLAGSPTLPRKTAYAPMASGRAKPAVPGAEPEAVGAAPFGHLALIAEAVEAKRMDVLLDPILGLADRKARHFELSVRLVTGAGDGLDEHTFARIAAGAGLLARIDAAKLAHAADVLQRLRSRGSGASLFSAIAGESLEDENFAGTFADILAAEEGHAARLVLTFAQAEARTFTPAHWRTITDMSAIGLKFALADVTDLDMDFEHLKRHGFDFIKLDARVFLEGLPAPAGHIPAEDICRHLSGLGLGLIVGGIVGEKDLARILGFGALLGQGALFGGPRSVELERERRAA